MTLDAQDIAAICDALLPRLKAEILAAVSPTPTKDEQIKAMARDPELAKQLFKRSKASGSIKNVARKPQRKG